MKFRIYGKEKTAKRFSAIDVENGAFVNRLLYATVLERDEAERVIAHLVEKNPNFDFILKRV